MLLHNTERPRPVAKPHSALPVGRTTIEATYGRELIVLDESGGARAVTLHHHEHEHGEP